MNNSVAVSTIMTFCNYYLSVQFSSATQLCPILCDLMDCSSQASLSFTNSWNLLKLMSIKSVMPSNYLILCRPLLLLPSIFPSIRVFSNESVLRIRWPKYWSFSISISFNYSLYLVTKHFHHPKRKCHNH